MRPMSKPQIDALSVLAAHGKGSAYELRRSRTTLDALVRRGLASSGYLVGAIAMPRTSIIYRITEAGRAALITEAGRAALKKFREDPA